MNYYQQIYNFAQSHTIKTEKIIKPFWENKVTQKSPEEKKRKIKFYIKWIKFIVYSFVFIIALWGCFEQFGGAPNAIAIPSPGQGLEYGFPPGTTGDWRFDLSSSGTGTYWTYSSFSMAYSPFISWFVYPIAWITFRLIYSMQSISYGGFSTLFGMLVVLIIMRSISFWPSLKSSLITEKQLEHQGAIAEINAKYAKIDKTDREAKIRKNQELRDYNKKHNINPLGALERIFIDMPIFLIIYKLFTIIRPIKTTILFGIWDLAAIPFYAILQNFGNGGWVYLFLLLFVLPTQFFSQKLPMILSRKRSYKASALTIEGKKANKKNKNIQNILTIMFLVFSIFLASGLGVYYFFSALITITQTITVHKIILKKRSRGENIDNFLEKRFGIKATSLSNTKFV